MNSFIFPEVLDVFSLFLQDAVILIKLFSTEDIFIELYSENLIVIQQYFQEFDAISLCVRKNFPFINQHQKGIYKANFKINFYNELRVKPSAFVHL